MKQTTLRPSPPPPPFPMSSPAPSPSADSPPGPTFAFADRDSSYTKAVLVLIFLAMFIRLLCVSRTRDPDTNPTQSNQRRGNQNVVIKVGLEQNVINSCPSFLYSKGAKDDGGRNNDTECPICICEFMESEIIRMMPQCRHYFHLDCLDAWLRLNGSCPVCRDSPLQRVVPPSENAADRR